MKSRPIIFSGPMVRAIMDGRKTQTRRPIKPQPEKRMDFHWWYKNKGLQATTDSIGIYRMCPYGVPGDRLWVRETWAVQHAYDGWKPRELMRSTPVIYMATWEGPCGLLKRHSIHMPRWASRITLEILDVRVERVQEISEGGSRGEGIIETEPENITGSASTGDFNHKNFSFVQPKFHWNRAAVAAESYQTARAAFCALWDSIYGKKPGMDWASSPWVWAIEFKRIDE
jgi:hypothetical protein